MTFGILLKSRIGDKDYGSGKIVRMSKQQQNMTGQIENKATVKEEMSEEMLREKLDTIRSKEQLDEENERLWEYVKSVMDDLIALDSKAKRMKANAIAFVKEVECKEKYLTELHDKAISIEAEVKTLLSKAQRNMNTMTVLVEKASHKKNNNIKKLRNKVKKKTDEANSAVSAASKKKDEIAELVIETNTIKDAVNAMFSKVKSDERVIEQLAPEVECKRDKLNALLSMMEGKHVEMGVLNQEPSDEDSARGPSEEDSARGPSDHIIPGLDGVLHKASRVFGSGKTESLYI